MKILVAGGTGAIGRILVSQLLNLGHEVTALGSHARIGPQLRAQGAKVETVDALDAPRFAGIVKRCSPEVIINQLTALKGAINVRNLDRECAVSNRLRTEATDTLLAAAREAGTRRLVQQSFCGWTYARAGGPVKSESDPLLARAPWRFRKTLAAIRHLESAVLNAGAVEALVLRYGFFYGPGTAFAKDGPMVELVRRRRQPIVGDGAGVWSFVHVADAARATVAAVTRGAPGIYNIVDDEPARVSVWLPHLANVLDAKPPRQVKPWLGRWVAGKGAVLMMTENRGASNAKARRELGWRPNYPSWRNAFAWMFGRMH